MGDSGAMLIGLMLGAASTSASGRVARSAYGPADMFTLLSPLILIAAVMFIPLLDMVMAVIRRTRSGVGFYTPDKMHLHHRLLEIGHTQRRVALVIYLWVGLLAFAVAASTLVPPAVVGPVFGVGVVLALIATFAPRLHRRFAR
jgi:UDP-GlcNAc:undecaprenyl-phosphate GlcNAc-1-phosphate transferase